MNELSFKAKEIEEIKVECKENKNNDIKNIIGNNNIQNFNQNIINYKDDLKYFETIINEKCNTINDLYIKIRKNN